MHPGPGPGPLSTFLSAHAPVEADVACKNVDRKAKSRARYLW